MRIVNEIGVGRETQLINAKGVDIIPGSFIESITVHMDANSKVKAEIVTASAQLDIGVDEVTITYDIESMPNAELRKLFDRIKSTMDAR